MYQRYMPKSTGKEKGPQRALLIQAKCLILFGFLRQAPGEPNAPNGSDTPKL